MPQLPTPLRAAIGLVATAMDEARHLPDKAIELPMLAVSTALQVSLRAQQRYAHLAARGDELLNRRETTDEPPPWATFDEPVAVARVDVVDDAPTIPTVQEASTEPTEPTASTEPIASTEPTAPTAPTTSTASTEPTEPIASTAPRKTVRRPRNGKPSPFDAIGDE
ncbi:MAG: hypothetical protein QOH14_1552 [Pseudonocardiales bacterium]|jgi:hypothetical protein|nr:hypothetical protein [Pseudonocardiales bacterium]